MDMTEQLSTKKDAFDFSYFPFYVKLDDYDELWTEVHNIVQKTGIKTIPMKKKCKRAKWLSEEALQIAV